jgi:hypothetical protein
LPGESCLAGTCNVPSCDGLLGLPALSVTTTAPGPGRLSLADLNGDGRLDAVTTHAAQNQIGVFLGLGDGRFGSELLIPVGNNPIAVAVGDLNLDGKLDLVVANRDDNAIMVLKNDGTATFTTHATIPVGGLPSAVAIGRFNADGRPDIVVGNAGSKTITLVYGGSSFTFGTPFTAASVLGAPMVIVTHDLNQDGKLDIVVAEQDANGTSQDGIQALMFDGSTFTGNGYGGGGRPTSLTVADVSGDGRVDLIFSSWYPNSPDPDRVNVMLSQPSTAADWYQPQEYTADPAPDSVAATDLNGDGKLDLAYGLTGGDRIAVRFNTGTGFFGPASTYHVSSGSASLASGDVNVDGKPDLVVTSSGSAHLGTLPNLGSGTFPSRVLRAASSPTYVMGVDVDNDADLDLVVGSDSATQFTVSKNGGNGAFAAAVAYSTPGWYPLQIVPSDLDQDGAVDLLVHRRSTTSTAHELQRWKNGGSGTFTSVAGTNGLGIGAADFTTADLDADGFPDLVSVTLSGLSVRMNDGTGTFLPGITLISSSDLTSTATADLDGDDFADIVVTDQALGVARVLMGDGMGFSAPMSFSAGSSPRRVRLADLNRDGVIDVLVLNASSDAVTVALGLGDGSFGPPSSRGVGSNPVDVIVTDLDNDGSPDIVVTNQGSSSLGVLRGDGSGSFGAMELYAAGTSPRALFAGRLDQDARVDLAFTNANVGDLSLVMSRCFP